MRLWQRIWPRKDEAAGQNKTAGRPKPSKPLLSEWPEGYTSFRLDGEDVILLGQGKPPLRLKGSETDADAEL
jgi:hypothetical protein